MADLIVKRIFLLVLHKFEFLQFSREKCPYFFILTFHRVTLHDVIIVEKEKNELTIVVVEASCFNIFLAGCLKLRKKYVLFIRT